MNNTASLNKINNNFNNKFKLNMLTINNNNFNNFNNITNVSNEFKNEFNEIELAKTSRHNENYHHKNFLIEKIHELTKTSSITSKMLLNINIGNIYGNGNEIDDNSSSNTNNTNIEVSKLDSKRQYNKNTEIKIFKTKLELERVIYDHYRHKYPSLMRFPMNFIATSEKNKLYKL